MTTATPGRLASPGNKLRGWAGRALMAATSGLLLGVLTNLAQGWLPGAWNQIANSGAIWCAVALAAGALSYQRDSSAQAAIIGLGAEAGLVAGYYGYAEFGRGSAGNLFYPLIWFGLAVVAGPLFGVAGHWWRRSGDARRRVAGLAAFAGLFGMEGLVYAWNLHYGPQAWTCLALFIVAPLLMARTGKERALTLGAAMPCALLAYALIELPLQAVSA